MLRRMYFAYMDDSQSQDRRFQVVGGVLLQDSDYQMLEAVLADIQRLEVPEEFRTGFEFHASDLFLTRQRFKDVPKQKAREILAACLDFVRNFDIPVLFAAVDVDGHEKTPYGNANPTTVAFRLCLDGVEEFFRLKDINNDSWLPIFDNVSQIELRKDLQKAFRDYRPRRLGLGADRGRLAHAHDDLYFGDSAFSMGIQLADVCAYFINRQLNGRTDTEDLYAKIDDNIFYHKVVPE